MQHIFFDGSRNSFAVLCFLSHLTCVMVVIHTTELLEGLSEGVGEGKIEENRTFMFFVKTRKTSYGF